MEKRDLKADLEQVRNFRSKWRQSTSLKETWDIGVAWEYFCRENAELWLEQALAEKERADKYEALVRELVYSLKLIRGSSQFSHTTWEEITDLANIALIGAEEVLGDGDHQCQDG